MAVALSDSAAVAALKPGDRLGGRYKLERLLGHGAAGQVWLGVHETIGRPVAIKVLRNESKGRAAVRFLQEARIAAQVQSRYVVSIFDFGNTPTGLLYMVMEHLHGETLGARLARAPALRVRDLIRYVCQALVGLHEVHRAGIVHRDLKPENIFLVEEGGEIFPKILDFGVSRADEGGLLGPEISKLTATGMTVGTPLYMAPEQARGKRDQLDARTDLYAIGVILYKAIAGEPPFSDQNVVDLLMAVVGAQVAPALVDVRDDVPTSLSEVVQKAMAPQQSQRPADAEELRLALALLEPQIPATLNCATGGQPLSSTDENIPFATLIPPTDMDPTMPQSLIAPATPLPRRPPRLWWVFGAGVTLLGAVALAWALTRPPPRGAPATLLPAPTPSLPVSASPARATSAPVEVTPEEKSPLPSDARRSSRPARTPVRPRATRPAERAPAVFTDPGF
ncbi:MAG: protein kinase [Myxococcales bacterium]|nr:protein kinase [Myxococcales bacterium]